MVEDEDEDSGAECPGRAGLYKPYASGRATSAAGMDYNGLRIYVHSGYGYGCPSHIRPPSLYFPLSMHAHPSRSLPVE